MPSSLPLLHNTMPTPCLNAFWHSDPYIFLHLSKCFLSCFCEIFGGHLSSLKTDNSTQPLPTENSNPNLNLRMARETRWIPLASAACGINNRRNRLLMEKSVRSGDRLASFPGGKPENNATWYQTSIKWIHVHNTAVIAWSMAVPRHVVPTFAHAHNNLKWRPTSRQVLECLVFRLMRTDWS